MPPASVWESPTTWKSLPASRPGASPAATLPTPRHWAWGLCVAVLLGAAAHSFSVVDQVGNSVREGQASRIVTLAPDVAELAFALGVGGSVVAVDTAADFPPEVSSLPRVVPTDLEAILALHPDLVLASTAGNDPRVVDRLTGLGIRVCTVDVTSFCRLAEACRLLGSVVDQRERGEAHARTVETRVAAAAARAALLTRRAALYVAWWQPLIVAAPGTFHDDLLRQAGLDNLAPAGAGRYPRVDPELLLDARLEVVVTPDEVAGRTLFDEVLTRPVGLRIERGAIRVAWLPADPASRPGPRLPEALEALVTAREANP